MVKRWTIGTKKERGKVKEEGREREKERPCRVPEQVKVEVVNDRNTGTYLVNR